MQVHTYRVWRSCQRVSFLARIDLRRRPKRSPRVGQRVRALGWYFVSRALDRRRRSIRTERKPPATMANTNKTTATTLNQDMIYHARVTRDQQKTT